MTTVKTQAEFDAALKALDGKHGYIDIESERGVWIEVRSSGSATVRAYDSATVRAYGSATVRAYDSATVRAYDSATVAATPHVAVHLHSARANVEGGVVIDVTHVNDSAEAWVEHHGITVTGGKAIVFKAVDDELESGRGFAYPIGETVTDKRWRDDNKCGGGLHFSPLPVHALDYFSDATRFLACEVDVADLRVIPGGTPKCKAKSARVLHEVTIDGIEVTR